VKSPLARVPARVSLVFLAMLVLTAVFADLLASDRPLMGARAGRVHVLPAIAASPETADAAGWDWALWPPIRASAQVPTPGAPHLLGIDADGVDVLARTIHGARSSVLVTALVLAVALVFGLLGGALAGYGPPIADALLARLVELSGALPTLVLLVLVRALEPIPSLVSFVAVLAVLRALLIARLVRGEVLRVAGQEFIVAARGLGASTWRIATRQILPHVMGPVLVAVTFSAASVVALEAALSLVGLGLPSDAPSWGALLGEAGSSGNRAVLAAPAAAIVATTLALWLVADALDDASSARRGRSRT
jgi:ABC-type dipeptide/oligopeptide/nickel transport system permease subunit